jgi:hypothetical protein
LTVLRIGVALVAPLVFFSTALAQTAEPSAVRDPGDLINWYYAATFGTGVYTSGDRTVSVLQVPFSRWLIEQENGSGLRFKVSTTLGFYDYNVDTVFSGKVPDRISTFSILPGLEWQLTPSPIWTVRPFVDAGFGQELTGRESAWIFDFGVKSRFLIAQNRGVEFAVVNSLTAAGYRQRGGTTNTFGYLATGLDMTIPTERRAFGRDLFIGFTPIYFYYFNRFSFAEFNDPQNRIREEFELALSVVTQKPWSFKFFNVERVGVAIRTSGDVTGVSIFTSLPF